MIINIVYKETKNFDVKRFEGEVNKYGDTFIMDRYEDKDGMKHGSLLLAFGGNDFQKVYYDLYSMFYDYVSFKGYKISEVYQETGTDGFEWMEGYFGNKC